MLSGDLNHVMRQYCVTREKEEKLADLVGND